MYLVFPLYDPLSPKLFTATNQDAFRKIELEERGLNIDGDILSELTFADDIALITTTVRNMEEHLNMINDESKKIGLKIHRGKTKSLFTIDYFLSPIAELLSS